MSMIDKKYNFLKPIKVNDLKRIGRNEDGGYVVDFKILKQSNVLLSFGLGSDWSFEIDYLKKNQSGKIYIYDHTVDIYTYLNPLLKCLKRFLTFRKNLNDLLTRLNDLNKYLSLTMNKNIIFNKKKAVYQILNENKETDVKKAFDKIGLLNRTVFKIDIEGDEYSLIDDILKQVNFIDMLIIEFHEIDKNEIKFVTSIKKLLNDFDIIHIHANNHCNESSFGLPTVLELTFNNKKFRPKEIVHRNEFPIKNLDFPNNPYKKDLKFSFED